MARRFELAGACAALALVIPLLTAGASNADRPPTPGGTAKVRTHCKLTAAAPTEANDQITGEGSIRCKKSRTVHMHIQTEILVQGQWSAFGSLDADVHVTGGQARHVSTGPAKCKGLGHVQARTVLRLVRFPKTLAQTTSPTVDIACSAHHH